MRILYATDGSGPANVALELIRGIGWPEGTIIRVVTTMPMGIESYGLSWATATADTIQHGGDEVRKHYEDIVDHAVRELAQPGVVVERLLLHGRPASAIVDEAREWQADLVVVGHRGRGTIGSMVLGSVSAEVVDHAPCPVLVVRRATVQSIVFATDGSPSARHAEELLARWPLFGDAPIRVVAVAPTTAPWAFGMAMDVAADAIDAYAADIEEARRARRPVADDAATRLREAGRLARSEVLDGEPAAAIVATLEAYGDDVVVLGSRGHTGLARLLLGSVARNVLIHAPSSVLIVREHARVAELPESEMAVELS
jgi:nucleotide-binding universal stress UspA family protein